MQQVGGYLTSAHVLCRYLTIPRLSPVGDMYREDHVNVYVAKSRRGFLFFFFPLSTFLPFLFSPFLTHLVAMEVYFVHRDVELNGMEGQF